MTTVRRSTLIGTTSWLGSDSDRYGERRPTERICFRPAAVRRTSVVFSTSMVEWLKALPTALYSTTVTTSPLFSLRLVLPAFGAQMAQLLMSS
ncbi:hypothetical protein D3C81_792870 [compost metagenome]